MVIAIWCWPQRLAHQDDADLAALRCQFSGRHEAVAAVVPGPGDDQDRPLARQLGCKVAGGRRDRLTGAQHQREAGRARRDREPVGALHLRGSENLHPISPKRLILRHFR